MKRKMTKILMYLLIIFFAISLFINSANANYYDISIVDTKADQINNQTVGNFTIRTFKITIVLYNSGDDISEEITVKLKEPELDNYIIFSPLNETLQPGQYKSYIIEEWPTAIAGEILLNISFEPSSPDSQPNDYNTGYQILKIPAFTSDSESTPGFSIILMLASLSFYLFGRNWIKK